MPMGYSRVSKTDGVGHNSLHLISGKRLRNNLLDSSIFIGGQLFLDNLDYNLRNIRISPLFIYMARFILPVLFK